MGTLRIKRGTKTALQTTPGYTPAEGELVYTTDSKEVFVGYISRRNSRQHRI